MTVIIGHLYRYDPPEWESYAGEGRIKPVKHQLVRVVQMRRAPKPHEMHHCHVVHALTSEFLGLVTHDSLSPMKERLTHAERAKMRTPAFWEDED